MSGTGILKIIKTTKRKYHSLRRRLRMAAPLWPTTPPSPPSPTLVPVPATRRARFLTRRSNARSKRPGRAPHAPQLTSSSSSSDLAGSGVAPLEPGLASSPLRGNPEAGIARVPPRPIDPNRTRSPFLSLPGEIRNEIYSYLAQYPTCQELYAGYNKRIDLYHARKRRNPDSSSSEEEEEEEKFPEYVRERELRTPTILLLCKAVTQECMPMLKAGTFVVDHLPPWRPGELRPMRLTEFISEGALQSLRRIEVYVQLGVGSYGGGWVWSQYFKDIVAVLCRRNSFDLFGVAFSMHNPSHHFMWLLEDPYLYRMGLEILQLKNHNPRWWVSMEGKVEAGWWTIKGDEAIPGIRDPRTKKIEYGHDAPDIMKYYDYHYDSRHQHQHQHGHGHGHGHLDPPSTPGGSPGSSSSSSSSSSPSPRKEEWVGEGNEEKLFGSGGFLEFL